MQSEEVVGKVEVIAGDEDAVFELARLCQTGSSEQHLNVRAGEALVGVANVTGSHHVERRDAAETRPRSSVGLIDTQGVGDLVAHRIAEISTEAGRRPPEMSVQGDV